MFPETEDGWALRSAPNGISGCRVMDIGQVLGALLQVPGDTLRLLH